jgi:hypothetical protein
MEKNKRIFFLEKMQKEKTKVPSKHSSAKSSIFV